MSILGGGYLQTNIMQLTEKMSRIGQAKWVEGSYFLTMLIQYWTMSISEQSLLMTWSKSNQFLGRSQYKGCPHCGKFSSLGFFTATSVRPAGPTSLKWLLEYLNTLCEHVRNSNYDGDMIGIETKIRFPEILLLTVFISWTNHCTMILYMSYNSPSW